MSLPHDTADLGEKTAHSAPAYDAPHHTLGEHAKGRQFSVDPEDTALVQSDQNALHRDLKGRHMQMIAMFVDP